MSASRCLVLVTLTACLGVKRYVPVEEPGACPAADKQDKNMTGAVSGHESAFRRSEVLVGVDAAAVIDRYLPVQSDLIASGTIAARISEGLFSGYLATTGAILEVHPSRAPAGQELSRINRGNVQGGLAVRWLKVPANTGDSYRRGIAVRADLVHGIEKPEDAAILERRPFAIMQYSPTARVQVMAEVRYELAGCYAPFLHAQFGGILGTTDEVAFPMTLTVGARRDRSLSIYGEFGALVNARGTTSVRSAQRFRIGLDWERLGGVVTPGALFEVNLGTIDGIFLGLTASFPFVVTR